MANLVRFGASGIVLFNFTHASAVPRPVLASNGTATGIAVAAISMVDGLYLTSTLLGGVPATIFASPKPPRIQVSGFSSAGPSPTLGLKPNIGAPGMLILSTLPSLDGKDVTYGIRSGTSMAAPYVTASVALLMEAIGIDKGADVYRRMLAHSARPVVFGTATSGQTLYESVVRQGSGVVDVDAAVKLRDIAVHPEKLILGDSSSSSSGSSSGEADSVAWREYQLEISNNGDKPLGCQVTHWPSVSLMPFDDSSSMLVQHPRWSELTATASILHPNITIEPGQPPKRVNVAIQAPQLLDVSQHWIYSGYIRIACSGDYPHIHVPYLGMHGSLNSVPILDINSDMPTLHSALTLAAISHDASSTSPAASPVTVSTKDADYVVLNVRVVYPTPLLQIRVLNATDDSSLGLIADGGYHPWAGTSGNRTYQFSWDGQVIPVPKDTESETSSLGDVHSVPDGSYRLRVEALRPGSANDERLFDMWTSARFIIKH
ncbi:subtilisin-like protein [Ramicandelaber brevisporus]|nr:subtilisin-like protein [Ramicandelaber brevisporus]